MDQDLERFFEEGGRSSYPTLSIFVKKYLRPMEGNDKKALSVFCYYETKEASRRLEAELFSIKRLEASRNYLQALIGEAKARQYKGFDKWASIMLQILPSVRHG